MYFERDWTALNPDHPMVHSALRDPIHPRWKAMMLANYFAGATNPKFLEGELTVQEIQWRIMRELFVGKINLFDDEGPMVTKNHKRQVYIIRIIRVIYRGVL